MTWRQFMGGYRERMAYWWIALGFGAIYLISQVTIGVVLEHIGPLDIGRLQVTGFTAEYYRETFARWQSTGAMAFYRAHFIFDGIHWLWYALSLTAFLAIGMRANAVSSTYDWILALPLVAGLCDCYENHVQLIFLSDPTYQTVVDPLPLLSTVASITKWSLVALILVTILALSVRATLRRAAA